MPNALDSFEHHEMKFTISDESQVSFRDLYLRLCECRDFEIKLSWERSVFMTAFLITCYAGYGGLICHTVEKSISLNSPIVLVCAVGVASIGVMVSFLWILMSKGSKAWYEHYERAISCFPANYVVGSEERKLASHSWRVYLNNNKIRVQNGAPCPTGLEKDVIKSNPFSLTGGPYSVSKVVIAIGILSLIIWATIATAHIIFYFYSAPLSLIAANWSWLKNWVVAVYFLGMIISLWLMSRRLKSRYLKDLRDDTTIAVQKTTK